MLDITTSVVAGGKFQVKQARGERIPEGWMIDAEGKPLDDPDRFFGDGAVLPLGGFQFGHKGFGLAMVIEALAGGLTGAGCTREEPTRGGSGFLAMAIRIADFIDPADFEREIDGLLEKIKSELISERELQKAKNQIESSYIYAQDSIFGQTMKIGYYEAAAGWRMMDAYLDGIRRVTREDIRRVAKQYLDRDRRTVGILIPTKEKSQ